MIRLVPVPLEPEALLAASLRSCRPILCTRANGCTLAVCASVVRYSLAGLSDRTATATRVRPSRTPLRTSNTEGRSWCAEVRGASIRCSRSSLRLPTHYASESSGSTGGTQWHSRGHTAISSSSSPTSSGVDDPVAQELLHSANLARLAYTGATGRRVRYRSGSIGTANDRTRQPSGSA